MFNFLTDKMFIIDLIIIMSCLMFNFKRRKYFFFIFPVAIAVSLCLSYFLPRYIIINGFLSNFIWWIFDLFLVLTIFYLSFDASLWKIFFVGAAVYFIQNGSFCLDRTIRGEVQISLTTYLEHYLFILGFIVLIYLLYWRKVNSSSLDNVKWYDATIILSVSLIVCLVLSSLAESIHDEDLRVFYGCSLASVIVSSICQFSIFKISALKNDRDRLEEILSLSEKQYELSKQTIEGLNIKYHDLKYKIQQIQDKGKLDEEEINEMNEVLNQYSSFIHTSNQKLNVILTEKNILCTNLGIEFTCSVCDDPLSNLNASDIYTFFSNALDNAIEATKSLDKDEKIISLNISSEKGMTIISLKNYFKGNIKFSQGIPITSKEDKANHGFGTKSLVLIAKKYHGQVLFTAKNQVFTMLAAIPVST